MRVRIAKALLTFATVLVAASAAAAQTPSERQQQRVYRDYRTDGLIDACGHDVETLRAVLGGIQTSTDVNSPDFRPQVEAAIQEHESGSCEDEQAPATGAAGAAGGTDATDSSSVPSATGDTGTSSGDTRSGSTGDTGSGTSGDAKSGASSDSGSGSPDDTSSSDSGDLGGAATGGGGGGGSDNSSPPTAADVDPLPTETPVPAATPVPTPAEAAPPAATPAVVYRNADDGIPLALIALAALSGALALLALTYAVVSRLGWGERRLARPRRAWREAAFRAGGAWGDFTDWLRLGR